VYRQIGVEVKRRGAHAWDERAGTSKATKLRCWRKGAAGARLASCERECRRGRVRKVCGSVRAPLAKRSLVQRMQLPLEGVDRRRVQEAEGHRALLAATAWCMRWAWYRRFR
jgi:hypothetical protein